MCSGDDTLEPPKLAHDAQGNIIEMNVDGAGYQHSCKNTDYLYDIVASSEENAVQLWDWQVGDTVQKVFGA